MSEYDSERTKYSHFQTPNLVTDSNHQNAISASVLASNSASLLAIGPDACNSLLPSEYAIQTPYISALTLKVLKGSALRGGYCHEPGYLHFIITILTSIMDLSIYFPPDYSSYPFHTA